MIGLGIILLILGYVLKVAVLQTIGVVLLVIGAVLWVLGSVGRPESSHRYAGALSNDGRYVVR